MKKGLVILVAVVIMASFLVLADSENSNYNSSPYETNSQMEQEQNSGDMQNQEQNENMLGEDDGYEYHKGNLTQEQIREIIQERNQIKLYQNGSEECPSNCSCQGSAVSCNLQNGRTLMIQAGESNNTIIQIKSVNASTQVQLYKSEDGKLYGTFGNNTTEIILPDQIQEMLMNQTRARLQNATLNLTEDGTYLVQARKQAKLFWVFSVQEKVNAEVDAETGEVTQTRNSWWGFLAKDVESE